MTYAKPEVVALGGAIRLTKGQPKMSQVQDNNGTKGTTQHTPTSAYEADE